MDGVGRGLAAATSGGGAATDAAYRAWIDGFVKGLGRTQQANVIVEPDGLANLPSDCGGAYPGQDVDALTAGRFADIRYAGGTIAKANRQAKVYLDTPELFAWTLVIVLISVGFEKLFMAALGALERRLTRL